MFCFNLVALVYLELTVFFFYRTYLSFSFSLYPSVSLSFSVTLDSHSCHPFCPCPSREEGEEDGRTGAAQVGIEASMGSLSVPHPSCHQPMIMVRESECSEVMVVAQQCFHKTGLHYEPPLESPP